MGASELVEVVYFLILNKTMPGFYRRGGQGGRGTTCVNIFMLY